MRHKSNRSAKKRAVLQMSLTVHAQSSHILLWGQGWLRLNFPSWKSDCPEQMQRTIALSLSGVWMKLCTERSLKCRLKTKRWVRSEYQLMFQWNCQLTCFCGSGLNFRWRGRAEATLSVCALWAAEMSFGCVSTERQVQRAFWSHSLFTGTSQHETSS